MRRLQTALWPGLLFFGTALGSILVSRHMATAASLWPVNAVALVMILRLANRRVQKRLLLAGLALATGLANLAGGSPPLIAAGFGVLNALDVLLSVVLVQRYATLRFRSAAEGWRFFFVAGPPGALLGGGLAALLAVVTHQPDGWAAGPTWFCADLLGFVLVGPLGMTISRREVMKLDLARRWPQAVLLGAVTICATLATFAQSRFPLLFVVSPFVLLTTYRFRLVGANVALLLVAAVAIPLTGAGSGPLALVHGASPGLKLILLQLFLGLNGLTAVPLAAALTERDHHLRRGREREAELAAKNAELEHAARIADIADGMASMGHFSFRFSDRRQVWSPGVYAILGFPREAAPPPIEAVIGRCRHDREAALAELAVAIQAKTGLDWEREIERPDGSCRWVRLRAEPVDVDGDTLLLGAVRDVTEERRAAAAFLERERSFRLLAENATDIIARFGLDGCFTYLSPSIQRVLGYAPEELLGRSSAVVMHPDDHRRSVEIYRAHLAEGAPEFGFEFEYRAFRKDGGMVWLSGRPRAVRDPATGELCGFQDVVRDVTNRVELVEALRVACAQAEVAAQAKAEFLANMSHELRTPLTSILGFSNLLRPYVGSEPASRYLQRIADGGGALLSTVNDILDFSKLEAGQIEIKPAAVSPAELCRSVCDLLQPQADQKDLSLSFVPVGAAPPAVWLDGERLRQVLINLVGNALKFTDSGSVRLVVRPGPERLRIEVADTGPGVPADRADRLFQRFSQIDGSSTRLHGGTGLGLAISKGLVEAMGGEIGLTSTVGRGSTFWCDLPAPAVCAVERQACEDAASENNDLTGVRLLVVDDNRMNRELVRILASEAGVQVSEADSGEAAVDAAGIQTFDVILMDVSMPGMGGSAAVRAIRSAGGLNHQTPILAFTAFTPTAAPSDVDFSLFDAAVTKPITPRSLLSEIAARAAIPTRTASPMRAFG